MDRLRRLDRLFAERVLGWTDIGPAESFKGLLEESEVFSLVSLDENLYGRHPKIPEDIHWLPRYTRSLDAAWEGASKFKYGGFRGGILLEQIAYMLQFSDEPHTFKATIQTDRIESAYAEHPAEALVLACLRAVGVSEEELNA